MYYGRRLYCMCALCGIHKQICEIDHCIEQVNEYEYYKIQMNMFACFNRPICIATYSLVSSHHHHLKIPISLNICFCFLCLCDKGLKVPTNMRVCNRVYAVCWSFPLFRLCLFYTCIFGLYFTSTSARIGCSTRAAGRCLSNV